MVPGLAARSDSKHPRRWRSLLAALVSLALALSFLHSSDFNLGNNAAVTVVAAQAGCDTSGKSADWGAPHGDHCLAHVTTVAPHDDAIPIEYVTRVHHFPVVLAPKTADLATPFKPPRA
jgi:hypothetical protein